jgi:hypothetical protein
MQIANPIYDVVFKYLMEDAKVAKLLISSIIGEEIEELEFRPQEYTSDVDKGRIEGFSGTLTVYRLDFNARIKTAEGSKDVLIELQKAKFATDIMRFRNYLAGQYGNYDNTQMATIHDHQRRVGIPIISIYFLGHRLDHTEASIIGVSRIYQDLVTGEQINVKESFIESLTHDSYIIQIPQLAKKRRNDLEKLLSIFDQSESIDQTHHILNINEADYPVKYGDLIRRLRSVILEPEIRKQMKDEDIILLDYEDMQRALMDQREHARVAKLEASEAKQEAIEAKQEASEAKQEACEAKMKIAANFKKAGVALEIIIQATGLSHEEINEI